MNIKLMHIIDTYIGICICFALTLFDKILKFFNHTSPRSKREKFLFIELPEMGSVILSYKAIIEIKKNHPQAEIYFLMFEKNKESLLILDLIKKENILTIRSSSLPLFITDTLYNIYKLWKIKIDVCFDLEPFSRFSCIFSYLIQAKERIGFFIPGAKGIYRGDILTKKVRYNYYYHISQNYYALVKALDAMPDSDNILIKNKILLQNDKINIKIENSKELEKKLYNQINIENFEEKRKIILAPSGGALPIRAWPENNYIELAEKLLEDERNIIILIGTDIDRQTNRDIRSKIDKDRCIDLTGQTRLKELICLYNMCDVLVTNDGGPAHFAVLTDIKTFIFFGPETPLMYAPLSDNINILYSKFWCSPCLLAINYRISNCKDNKCLKFFTVDYIYNLVCRELN